MKQQDIMARLQADAGTRTIGELVQDREAAIQEINRLRRKIDQLEAVSMKKTDTVVVPVPTRTQSHSPGTLIDLKELSRMIGLSRSTIYKRVSEGSFPPPLKVGVRSVRWLIDDVQAWVEELQK